jgi:hypothetical protein
MLAIRGRNTLTTPPGPINWLTGRTSAATRAGVALHREIGISW